MQSPQTNEPDPYAKLRRFIENPPRNVALVFATGWHTIATELMRKMMAVIDAAEVGMDESGRRPVEDALEELKRALGEKK